MQAQPGNYLAASGLPVFHRLGEAAARLPPPRNPCGRSVRVWARSLSVMQKEAVVLSTATGNEWRLASDEGPYLDGFDASIAFCFITQLGRYASILKKKLAAHDVIQDLHLPQQGSGPVDPVETHVYLTRSEDADFARSALAMGEQTCFLHALCRTDLAVESSVAAAHS